MTDSPDALQSEFFRSPAHPALIRILELPVAGDRSVTEPLPAVRVEASNLSQQLGVLRKAGVVSACRHGNSVTYSMGSPHIAELERSAAQPP